MGGKKKAQKKVNKKALSNVSKEVIGCEHLAEGFSLKKLPNIGKIQRSCQVCSPSVVENISDDVSEDVQTVPVEAEEDVSIHNALHSPSNTNGSEEISDDIWICLLCAREGCSRTVKGHSLGHYETRPQHCIALSLKNFSCWCYKCDDEIYITSGILSDYILALRKRFDPASLAASSGDNEEVSSTSDMASSTDTVEKPSKKKNSNSHSQCNGSAPRSATKKTPCNVKGLANIGNTCFFNSTLQCLFHSSHIENDLDSLLKASTYMVACTKDNGLSSATIPIRPADKCPMSNALRDLFVEMNTSSNPLIYPNLLFNQICAKVPRFRGYQQQDAHELLRHLLDTVKNEEVQRVKAALLEKLFPNGAKSTEDSSRLKRVVDSIGNSTLVDGYFGGEMVDTIVCMECHTINTVLQHFLDISLPLKRPKFEYSADDNRNYDGAGKGKRNKLRIEKKRRKPKEDKDGDWGNDDEDEEVRKALAMSMESDIPTQSTIGRPDSGLGSGSSGGDPADSSGLEGLPLVTPTESEELIDENLLASIAALHVSTRESFPAAQRMSNKELKKRLQTLGNRPPPAEDETSIYSALYWYTEREELKRENRYACESCQHKTGNKNYLTEGSKQALIAKPPKILTLHLKRFEQVESRRSMVLQKISDHVEFPAELDIAPFLSREAVARHWKEAKALAAEDALPNSVVYSLRGVVEHSGSLNGGHYIAYVRPSGKSSSINDDWFMISDGHVRSVSLDNVLRANAYILFYELDLKA